MTRMPQTFIAVIACLLAIWLVRNPQLDTPNESTAEDPERATAELTDERSTEASDVSMETTAPVPTSQQEAIEEIARRQGVPPNVLTQQAMIQWSNMWHEFRATINVPIEFYGRTVDEGGVQVKGATVSFDCHVYSEEILRSNTVTDANGYFALTGVTGATLRVSLSKPGYEEVEGTNQHTFEYYSPGGGGFRGDPNSPVVFHIRKATR